MQKRGASKFEAEKFDVGRVYSKDEFILICSCLISRPGMTMEARAILEKNLAWAEAGGPESSIVWEQNPVTGVVTPIRTHGVMEVRVADGEPVL